jgi:uncharacterized membrane protein
LVMVARGFWTICNFVDRQLKRFLSPRISYVASALLMVLSQPTSRNCH